MTGENLTGIWAETWKNLGARPPSEAELSGLLASYSESHRRYHDLRHLEECLVLAEEFRNLAPHPWEVTLALWYHDVLYDTHRRDNEERSADSASKAVLAAGLSSSMADRIASSILATRHGTASQDDDGKLVTDIDLAILGAPPARFAEYEEQIREEYRWVSEDLFRSSRASILEGFLRRPGIFSNPPIAQRFEIRARENLVDSIRRLKGFP